MNPKIYLGILVTITICFLIIVIINGIFDVSKYFNLLYIIPLLSGVISIYYFTKCNCKYGKGECKKCGGVDINPDTKQKLNTLITTILKDDKKLISEAFVNLGWECNIYGGDPMLFIYKITDMIKDPTILDRKYKNFGSCSNRWDQSQHKFIILHYDQLFKSNYNIISNNNLNIDFYSFHKNLSFQIRFESNQDLSSLSCIPKISPNEYNIRGIIILLEQYNNTIPSLYENYIQVISKYEELFDNLKSNLNNDTVDKAKEQIMTTIDEMNQQYPDLNYDYKQEQKQDIVLRMAIEDGNFIKRIQEDTIIDFIKSHLLGKFLDIKNKNKSTLTHAISLVRYLNTWYLCDDIEIIPLQITDEKELKKQLPNILSSRYNNKNQFIIKESINKYNIFTYHGFIYGKKNIPFNNGIPLELNNSQGICYTNAALQVLLATNLFEDIIEQVQQQKATQQAATKPASQQPATQQPATKPATKPASQQPATQQPASQQPSTQQPATKPASQQPATQQAASQQPATKPASQQPASQQPASQQPATKPATKPASQQPATKPASQQPATKPASQQPATQQAATKPATKPASQQPATKPATQQVTQQTVQQEIQQKLNYLDSSTSNLITEVEKRLNILILNQKSPLN